MAAGQAIWTVATSAGLAAILVASAPAFAALRLAGAAYLVWLGARTVWAAGRPAGPADGAGEAGRGSRLGSGAAFRHGMLSNLGSPKMAAFFTSLLPRFTPAGEASLTALLGLGFLLCALTLAWLAGYAVAIPAAGRALGRPRVRHVLEVVTGTVLVALGLRLALDSR